MKLVLLITLSFLFGCQGTEKHHAQLSNQRLAPRPGYDGHLTNRICKEKDWLGDCKKWSVKAYDIRDRSVREMLNEFRIACKIGGKRYRVDIDRPGFVRKENPVCVDKSIFGNCKEWVTNTNYIPIQNYEYLIEAQTQCMKGW